MAAMSTIGNSPRSSLPTSILTPSIEPENSTPAMPWMPVTLADSVSTKLAGSAWMSGHSMPMAVMRTGSQLGHLKLSPLAPPTERNTPKPGRVWNEPSPRKAKFRASPAMTTLPTFTSAPTDWKLTSGSSSAAPVSMLKPRAVSVRNEPSVIRIVSASKRNAETLPSSNSSVARIASVSGRPGRSVGSEPTRSLIVAEIGRPGRNRTPPVAKKMLPSKSTAWPKVTPKFWTPILRSSNSRIEPNLMPAPAPGPPGRHVSSASPSRKPLS